MLENEVVQDDPMHQNPDNDIRQGRCQLSALQNDVILRNVFKFVDFQTLKTCRLVHSKWKFVCETSFRKRAKVNCIKSKNRNVDCDVSILQRLFSQEEFEVPITTLLLGGHAWWEWPKLQAFFGNEGKSITELVLENLVVFENEENNYEGYDEFLSLMQSLKRLKIIHGVKDRLWPPLSTSFTVSLDALQSLDYLHLCNCRIIFGDERFSPKELVLEGCCEYFWKGIKMQETILPLNDVVNFRRLESLSITDSHCNISVNFKGEARLKYLALSKNIQMLNFESSQWSIESLRLDNMDFLRRTQIPTMIKVLNISRSKIDLSLLPATIESLTFESCQQIKLPSDRRMYVPKLKHLRSINNTSFDFLAHFKTCDTVTELRLELTNHFLTLNVENIPSGVKKLVLNKEMTKFSGIRSIQLDTLALVGCRFNDWEFDKLPVKNIFCLKGHGFIFRDDAIRKIIQISKDNCETISAGAFTWSSEKQFSESCIFSHVNKQAEYYTFKAGRGEAIAEKLVWDKCWSWTD